MCETMWIFLKSFFHEFFYLVNLFRLQMSTELKTVLVFTEASIFGIVFNPV